MVSLKVEQYKLTIICYSHPTKHRSNTDTVYEKLQLFQSVVNSLTEEI